MISLPSSSRRALAHFLVSSAIFFGLLLAENARAAPLFQAGSFQLRTLTFATGIATGDFDGDGNLDFATSKGIMQVGVGRGDGTFLLQDVAGSSNAGALASGDLNGDGIPDVAAAGYNLEVFFGSPGAGLGRPTVLSSGTFTFRVAIADVNGDGHPDLVTADSELVVYLGNGAGAFGPRIASPLGNLPIVVDLAVGDIDEDGIPDVLIVNTQELFNGDYRLGWMRGQGDGTFAPAQPVPVLPNSGRAILADLNGDGHLDAVSDAGWSAGHGDGSFDPPQPFPDLVGVEGIADLTGDGIPDLVAVGVENLNSATGAEIRVYRGDGAGGFVRTWSAPLFDFEDVAFGDANHDGKTDIFTINGAIANTMVYINNGDGTFRGERHYATGNNPSGVVLADVTGDKRLDAITSNQGDGTVSVLPGLPGGQFGPHADYPVGAGPSGIAAGDVNGDGLTDIVTSDAGSSTVSVLLGLPGGGLGSAITTPLATPPVALGLGDIDRDGRLDVVVSEPATNTIQILRGTGAGWFLPGPSYATAGHPGKVVIGDLDGDGWPDVVETTTTDFGPTDVFRGNGSGGLLPRVSYSAGGRAVAIADVTGDGIPDVVAVARNSITVLKGTGGGALTAQPFFVTSQARAIAVADANMDGKPDLFVAADWACCVWFFAGKGGGSFAQGEGYGAHRGPNGIAVGDLNGDGALDVVTSDGDTSLVSVLLGNQEQPVPALASLVSAEATESGVHIEWLIGASAATVERSENGAAWTSLGPVAADASGRLLFEDHDVKAGADYAYRLGFAQGGQTVYAGLVSVHVPLSATLALAASPNPAQGAFGVSFSLPDSRPARLEVYDVSGRRVQSREVGAMGAGTHIVRLEESQGLASGVYWMRLVHPSKTLTVRAALVR